MSQERADASATHWQTKGGERWVQRAEQTELQLRPFGERVLAELDPQPGEWALDVGCGAGDTVLELARRVGDRGGVCGADIAPPMLECARARAQAAGLAHVEFVLADAQTHAFSRSFDLLFSRFGVMFFTDPRAAFMNLRRALKAEGRLAFVCWQSFSENIWAQELLGAALSISPAAQVPDMLQPDRPGPFSLGSRAQLEGLLSLSGFREIAVDELRLPMQLGGAQTLAEAVEFCLDIGPAARVLEQLGDSHRAALAQRLAERLGPYTDARGTFMPGAVFVVRARA